MLLVRSSHAPSIPAHTIAPANTATLSFGLIIVFMPRSYRLRAPSAHPQQSAVNPDRFTPITDLNDPRVSDYRAVKERQLLPEFDQSKPPSPALAQHPGKFLAEGEVVLRMLLRSRFRTLSILGTLPRLLALEPEIAHLSPDIPIYCVDHKLLEPLVGFNLHRGLMAVGLREPPTPPEALFARVAPGRPVVALENLVNHDNIGSIFRSAAALGAAGILLSPQCADPLYRKSLRVSVGCALHLPFARLTTWPDALHPRDTGGFTGVARPLVLALTPAADAIDLEAARTKLMDTKQSAIILVGTEGPGLSPEAQRFSDLRVRIPMAGGVDSLNVAVTTAIVLSRLAVPES